MTVVFLLVFTGTIAAAGQLVQFAAIRRAPDVAALTQCAADIRALSHTLVAQGVAAGHLTRMISSLNDQLTARILERAARKFDLAELVLRARRQPPQTIDPHVVEDRTEGSSK